MSISTKSAIVTGVSGALARLRAVRVASAPAADGARAIGAAAGAEGRAGTAQTFYLPSRDSRYVRFVEAVRALRLDPEVTTMTRAEIERAKEAARQVFMADDGVPKEVRPPEAPPAGGEGAADALDPTAPEEGETSDRDFDANADANASPTAKSDAPEAREDDSQP